MEQQNLPSLKLRLEEERQKEKEQVVLYHKRCAVQIGLFIYNEDESDESCLLHQGLNFCHAFAFGVYQGPGDPQNSLVHGISACDDRSLAFSCGQCG